MWELALQLCHVGGGIATLICGGVVWVCHNLMCHNGIVVCMLVIQVVAVGA